MVKIDRLFELPSQIHEVVLPTDIFNLFLDAHGAVWKVTKDILRVGDIWALDCHR